MTNPDADHVNPLSAAADPELRETFVPWRVAVVSARGIEVRGELVTRALDKEDHDRQLRADLPLWMTARMDNHAAPIRAIVTGPDAPVPGSGPIVTIPAKIAFAKEWRESYDDREFDTDRPAVLVTVYADRLMPTR